MLFLCTSVKATAQFTLSGRVYDQTRLNLIEGVKVVSQSGRTTYTDSMGKYHILVNDKDSVSFIYRNKPTLQFAVNTITNPEQFDLFLHVYAKGKYSTLKEVVVYGKSYRRDSIENRETYADVFGYRKPGVRSSITPDGMVGADVNELINLFRFQRNRRLKAFRARLEMQEQEKYVNYRFNKTFVKRLTNLEGPLLDSFMVAYRPEYEFLSLADEIVFTQYVLNAFYQYKIDLLNQDGKK